MRLRYVHFPRCGPLVDVGIVFGQEKVFCGWTPDNPARRKGSVNFVVGVNGTGKSSLLRAIYQSFRALKNKDLPPLPVTLAWDRFEGEKRVTCLLHHPDKADEKPWFAVLNLIKESTHEHAVQWQALVHQQGKMLNAAGSLIGPLHFVGNEDSIVTPLLDAHLPQRLVAYTSGDQLLWTQAELPKLPIAKADELEDGGDIDDDRPPGWSIEREWSEDVSRVVGEIIDRHKDHFHSQDDTPLVNELKAITQELAPLKEIRAKRALNLQKRAESNPNAVFRVRQRSLRVAGIAVALWQAAKELKGRNAQWQRDELRKQLRDIQARTRTGDGARRILSQLDWFWPTHLSFTYRSADLELSPLQEQQMLCFIALADEVTVQPRGHLRAVIYLGPVSALNLPTRLSEATQYELPATKDKDTPFDMLVRRVNESATGAEAILRIFSGNAELESTLMEAFEGLHSWEDSGLIGELTLTIKRLNQVKSFDGELDDAVIRYEDLSDGEQMLLGRMALFFLLRHQDGALLLLDEPETHFNDVWKREIVDWVDEYVLIETLAQVLISTHTSIALTDAFAREIAVFQKSDDSSVVHSVAGGTFGTDPSEIMTNLFGAESGVGSRSLRRLDELLKHPWSVDDIEELEYVLTTLGSSFHRAELRAKLEELKNRKAYGTA